MQRTCNKSFITTIPCMHASTGVHRHACIIYICICTHTYIHTYMHAGIQIYPRGVYTCTHACVHTPTHRHTFPFAYYTRAHKHMQCKSSTPSLDIGKLAGEADTSEFNSRSFHKHKHRCKVFTHAYDWTSIHTPTPTHTPTSVHAKTIHYI